MIFGKLYESIIIKVTASRESHKANLRILDAKRNLTRCYVDLHLQIQTQRWGNRQEAFGTIAASALEWQ
jgi:hypothetical protein